MKIILYTVAILTTSMLHKVTFSQSDSTCTTILQDAMNAYGHWLVHDRDSAGLVNLDVLIYESILCNPKDEMNYYLLANISNALNDYNGMYRYARSADSLSMGKNPLVTIQFVHACFNLDRFEEGKQHFGRYCDYSEATWGNTTDPETMIVYASTLEECQGPDVAKTYMESKKDLIPEDLYNLWYDDVTDGQTNWCGYQGRNSVLPQIAPERKRFYSIEEQDTTIKILQIEKQP